ncbi:MAG: Fic family protein [Pseudomonadota bacterium]
MLNPIPETHPLAKWIDLRNRVRQYDFMETAFQLWLDQNKPSLSAQFLQELNFYAVHLLHPYPGQFRYDLKRDVDITNTPHTPPPWGEVEDYMHDFFEKIEQFKFQNDPLMIGAYVLWRLNWIHPFMQGNGRTSRAISYFIMCQSIGYWLPGHPIVPELIKNTRDEYCHLLRDADAKVTSGNLTELAPIANYLGRLLKAQLGSVSPS